MLGSDERTVCPVCPYREGRTYADKGVNGVIDGSSAENVGLLPVPLSVRMIRVGTLCPRDPLSRFVLTWLRGCIKNKSVISSIIWWEDLVGI